jgi:predicted secreted acid phosphatase
MSVMLRLRHKAIMIPMPMIVTWREWLIRRRWITERAPNVHRPALVLDIEETALSNWEIIKLDDFGRPIAGPCEPGSGAPCGWAAWDQLGRDPAIKPTLQVFRTARAANVAVFFITGRPESQRAATERN